MMTVNIRNSGDDVIWAVTTRMDPIRDTVLIDNTPDRDYLDFASPVSGLGSKMGMDATNKIGRRKQHVNGADTIAMSDASESSSRSNVARNCGIDCKESVTLTL